MAGWGGGGKRAGFPRWFIRLRAISFLELNFVLFLRTPIPLPLGRTLATVGLKTYTDN